jgi:anti-anti-sigma factor
MGMHGRAPGAAVTVTDDRPVQAVVLGGRLDGHTVTAVREELHTAVDGGAGDLVVDLSGVDLVDATGLGVLLGTRRRALRAGRRVVLRGTPPRLRRLLRATRMERILPTEAGVEPAAVSAASGA